MECIVSHAFVDGNPFHHPPCLRFGNAISFLSMPTSSQWRMLVSSRIIVWRVAVKFLSATPHLFRARILLKDVETRDQRADDALLPPSRPQLPFPGVAKEKSSGFNLGFILALGLVSTRSLYQLQWMSCGSRSDSGRGSSCPSVSAAFCSK